MPLILETVVTTVSPAGELHLVPFGLIREAGDGSEGGDAYVLAPFRPSPTIANLDADPHFAASSPRDVRVIAGAVTGRREWPTLPCAKIPGRRLADSFGHGEFAVERVTDDPTRPRYAGRLVHAAAHAPFLGHNRAQGAVIEAAILSTRLSMLARDKILSEMAYLAIAVGKTAGPREREAWGWIEDKVADAVGPEARMLGREG